MIVIDASALVAMLLDEPEPAAFFEVVGRSEVTLSPIGHWEAAIKLGRQRGERDVAELDQLLADFDIRVISADDLTAKAAVAAGRRFGKRTPAGLNLGDCFAYALAKELGAPLLYKGDDFLRTDVQAARIA